MEGSEPETYPLAALDMHPRSWIDAQIHIQERRSYVKVLPESSGVT